jgi:hypothetical protein
MGIKIVFDLSIISCGFCIKRNNDSYSHFTFINKEMFFSFFLKLFNSFDKIKQIILKVIRERYSGFLYIKNRKIIRKICNERR